MIPRQHRAGCWRADAGVRLTAAAPGGLRRAAARRVRTLDPGCFAFVMATGIVSVALLGVGQRLASAVLLGIALAGLVVLLAASAWRAVAFPRAVRADLAAPARAFAFFTVVAALSVAGVRLALAGQPASAGVLGGLALLAWLALSYLMPAGLLSATCASADGSRGGHADVNGTWFLWVVGTQSLALVGIALAQPGGPAGAPAWSAPVGFAAAALWSCGIILYLVILVLVLARMLLRPLRPADATPPYWIIMGAAAITVLAGAQLLQLPATPALTLIRPLLGGASIAFWAFATWLTPLLTAITIWRHAVHRIPLRYRGDLWAAVFPAGMYATASMQLGAAAAIPAITGIGQAAAWIAAAAWLATFTALLRAATRPRRERAR